MNEQTTRPTLRTPALPIWLMTIILWLAFGLRAYHLDYQSFWSDEGISLRRSAQPLAELLATMPIEHLPGYFLLLHYWLPWTGEHDFALRFLSLWPSVLSVALLYRLATDLGNRWVGLIAALLLATNAFQVWYAQEARTYSWLLATSLLATWCLWRLCTRHKTHPLSYLVGYIVATTATVYLHYYGFLTPLAHTLFAVGWAIWRRDWRFFGLWTLGGVITALLFSPWFSHALQIFDFTGWREPMEIEEIPWRILTAYTVSNTLLNGWEKWLPWLYLGLIILGAVLWLRWRRDAALLLLTCVLAPLAIVFGLTLRNPDFHERYTMTLSGLLLILTAAPLGVLYQPLLNWLARRRLVGMVALFSTLLVLLLLWGNGLALQTLYADPLFQKPDYRATVQMIQRFGKPGDIVLVDGPDPSLVFLHYYNFPEKFRTTPQETVAQGLPGRNFSGKLNQGDYPVHDLRFLLPADDAEVDRVLTELTADAKRVWEVLYFHEPWRVQSWLARHGWTAPPSDHNGIRLTLYGMGNQPLAEQPLNLTVGPALLLTKAMLPGQPVAPGDLLRVSTHWQVTAPAPEYKFSLRLQAQDGQILIAQDYGPHNWFTATNTWPTGQETIERRAFFLPADFAPGTYQITLRLYEPATGVVAETPLGQDILLGAVTVGE